MTGKWRQGRRRCAYAGTVAAAVAASLLAVPGPVWAEEPATVAVPAATDAVEPAAEPVERAPLATGGEVEILPGDGASTPGFRVVPAEHTEAGPYAYSVIDGTLRVQPMGEGEALPATEIEFEHPAAAGVASTSATTYSATLSIVNSAGVDYSTFYVWHRQTWVAHEVPQGTSAAKSTVKLPAGGYFAVASYQRGTRSYLLTRTFTVTDSGVTVRFDEKAAKQIRFAVDDPTARRHDVAAWITVPSGAMTGLGSNGSGRVYVTPFSVSGVGLRIHEVLVKQGTTTNVPSPYRYDLFRSFSGTVPDPPVVTVTTSSLAKTTTSARAQVNTTPGQLLSVATTSDRLGVYLESPIRAPGSFTEYVTPRQSFERMLKYGEYGHTLHLGARSLPAGASTGEVIGAAPLVPRRTQAGLPNGDSFRNSTAMHIREQYAFSDGTGNSGYDSRARASAWLRSEGQTLASQVDRAVSVNLSVAVPPEQAEYELEHLVTRRVPHSRLSTRVRSEWTFLSGGGNQPGVLPLIDLDFTVAGLNTRNTAGAAPVRIDVAADTRDVTATETVTGLEYSPDDGATWTPLTLTGSGDQVSAELAVPTTAAFISLRATAVDNLHGSVRRTVIRAFAGLGSQGNERVGTTAISKVVVDGGDPLVFGTSGEQLFTAQFTASDPSGIAHGDLYLYRGSYNKPSGVLLSQSPATCKKVNATTATCRATFRVDVRRHLGKNSLAGTWKVAAWAHAKDGEGFRDRHAAKEFSIKRRAKLTVNATPEPVRKGKTLTVKGKLTRADWETRTYQGYRDRTVRLQFRKSGTSTYKTVKKVKTNSTGNLKTTVTASVSGYWRYRYVGNSTTGAVSASRDYVKVKK